MKSDIVNIVIKKEIKNPTNYEFNHPIGTGSMIVVSVFISGRGHRAPLKLSPILFVNV